MIALRSALFLLCQLLLTPLFVGLMFVSAPFSHQGPRYFSGAWCRIMLRLGTLICRVRYTVQGWENLPKEPCVILAKHQSAWETMFFPAFVPPHCIVLKREILSIPFFGWGMAMLDPIAIDRDQPREAFTQVQTQGLERLKAGLHVVIFPEGTRVPFGHRARYATSGGLLAAAAGVPVVPLTHNAGQIWRKGLFDKHPGVIQVCIGPPISSAGREGLAVNKEAEHWIESRLEQISGKKAVYYVRKTKSAAARNLAQQHPPKLPPGASQSSTTALKREESAQHTPATPPSVAAQGVRHYRLHIEEQEVVYQVARRARRRSIGLIVNQSGLTVALPPWVTLQDAEQAIRAQWPWVKRKLAHWHRVTTLSAPQFQEGETLPWMGQTRVLRLYAKQLSLALEPEPALEPLEVDPRQGPVPELVRDWYRARALDYLPGRVAFFAEKLGHPLPRIFITNARTRWGSCNSRGEIRLHWRLMKASPAEIDYVVAHEVAHLAHLDHSPAFWATLARLYPDYEAASQALKRNDALYRQF